MAAVSDDVDQELRREAIAIIREIFFLNDDPVYKERFERIISEYEKLDLFDFYENVHAWNYVAKLIWYNSLLCRQSEKEVFTEYLKKFIDLLIGTETLSFGGKRFPRRYDYLLQCRMKLVDVINDYDERYSKMSDEVFDDHIAYLLACNDREDRAVRMAEFNKRYPLFIEDMSDEDQKAYYEERARRLANPRPFVMYEGERELITVAEDCGRRSIPQKIRDEAEKIISQNPYKRMLAVLEKLYQLAKP